MTTSEHKDKKQSDGPSLNIRGVLLHVLNDALGSVVVVVASVLFYVRPLPPDTPCNWQCYVDPSLTLVMIAIIMSSAVPLVKETTRILLQMSPPDVDVTAIMEKLCRLPGVLNVHEVHVWELVKDRNVASLHVSVTSDIERSKSEIQRLHLQIREAFHQISVHSVTIQMEFCDEEIENNYCNTPCISHDCLKTSCCPLESKSQNHTDLRKAKDCGSSGEVAVDLDATQNLLSEEETKQTKSTKF